MLKNIDTIFTDFDGVVVDTVACITSLYNEDFMYYKNFVPVNWWEVNTWDFQECNCANKEYINTYFNQPRFFKRLEFMPGTREAIYKLMERYKVKIVTHGFSPNLRLKEEWCKKNLPNIEVIGVNLKEYKDKSCVDMRNGFFLDDNSKNVQTCNAIDRAVFGDVYSWNEDWIGRRLWNWTDVERYLL